MNQDLTNMQWIGTLCMIAGAVFSLVVFVCVIVQTVLQCRILRELRRIAEKSTDAP